MASEMIERVARALCREAGDDPDETDITGRGGPLWRLWIDAARSAIEAMMEPTNAMLKAGSAHHMYGPGDPLPDALDAWRAMIDAALNE